jgi:aminoacyl tRNA synthase complex-interacting multifunctional protein 1
MNKKTEGVCVCVIFVPGRKGRTGSSRTLGPKSSPIYLFHSTAMVCALELIDNAIAELEARLKPGLCQPLVVGLEENPKTSKSKNEKPTKSHPPAAHPTPKNDSSNNNNNNNNNTDALPDICKLEFKVGIITKVWTHEVADKLYCEEIDVGETVPRQVASGLRPHFTLEQMMGQRLLVVTNLKAKNLVGFKSHGMVLCAAKTKDKNGSEEQLVEFVEPPVGAEIGEVVSFQGLAPPEPVSAAQVEKKKIFQACLEGLKTTEECLAAWNGHVFMTSAGPCRTKTIAGGAMR